jgi:hypothetical protein
MRLANSLRGVYGHKHKDYGWAILIVLVLIAISFGLFVYFGKKG